MLIFLGLLVGLMIVASLYVMSLRVVVPTNEVHIVQKGSKTISYGQDTKDNAGNSAENNAENVSAESNFDCGDVKFNSSEDAEKKVSLEDIWNKGNALWKR